MFQFIAVEHRHALARIEDQRDAQRHAVGSVLQHAVTAIGSNDRQFDRTGIGHFIFVRVGHRAWMEGGDLVVVGVGGNETLCSVDRFDGAHGFARNTLPIQSLEIVAAIVADRGHDLRITAQQLQIVGDITGATAKVAAHGWHQERDADLVQLIRQQRIRETSRELHDDVESQ